MDDQASAVVADAPKWKIPDDEFEDLIRRYCRDLTRLSREGRLDPVLGRDNELDQMTTILLQRGRSNVVLLGPAGTGKTAMFINLANHVVSGDLPDFFNGARVIELELSATAAGTEQRSEFEGRLIPIIQGVAERNASKKYPPIILMIDELHTIMPTCKASSASGVSDILKPYLTTGELLVVGATTVDEYAMFCKKDAALDRRFQKIHLEEPDIPKTLHICRGLAPLFSKHFKIAIPDAMIEKCVIMATRYLRGRHNPDKSLISMDAACAYAVKARKTEMDEESIRKAVANEAGIDPRALE